NNIPRKYQIFKSLVEHKPQSLNGTWSDQPLLSTRISNNLSSVPNRIFLPAAASSGAEQNNSRPSESTQRPSESAQGPSESTQRPSESAQGPSESTQDRVKVLRTERKCSRPSESAQGPSESTQGRVKVLKTRRKCPRPSESAQGPSESTQDRVKVLRTERKCSRPSESTQGPSESTQDRVKVLRTERKCSRPSESTQESNETDKSLQGNENFHTTSPEIIYKDSNADQNSDLQIVTRSGRAVGINHNKSTKGFGNNVSLMVKALNALH
ncbi:hypothetical protein K3495_g16558, partial [Podosphaera aphanis]